MSCITSSVDGIKLAYQPEWSIESRCYWSSVSYEDSKFHWFSSIRLLSQLNSRLLLVKLSFFQFDLLEPFNKSFVRHCNY